MNLMCILVCYECAPTCTWNGQTWLVHTVRGGTPGSSPGGKYSWGCWGPTGSLKLQLPSWSCQLQNLMVKGHPQGSSRKALGPAPCPPVPDSCTAVDEELWDCSAPYQLGIILGTLLWPQGTSLTGYTGVELLTELHWGCDCLSLSLDCEKVGHKDRLDSECRGQPEVRGALGWSHLAFVMVVTASRSFPFCPWWWSLGWKCWWAPGRSSCIGLSCQTSCSRRHLGFPSNSPWQWHQDLQHHPPTLQGPLGLWWKKGPACILKYSIFKIIISHVY